MSALSIHSKLISSTNYILRNRNRQELNYSLARPWKKRHAYTSNQFQLNNNKNKIIEEKKEQLLVCPSPHRTKKMKFNIQSLSHSPLTINMKNSSCPHTPIHSKKSPKSPGISSSKYPTTPEHHTRSNCHDGCIHRQKNEQIMEDLKEDLLKIIELEKKAHTRTSNRILTPGFRNIEIISDNDSDSDGVVEDISDNAYITRHSFSEQIEKKSRKASKFEFENWVQCYHSKCNKWRNVPPEGLLLGQSFYCGNLPKPNSVACSQYDDWIVRCIGKDKAICLSKFGINTVEFLKKNYHDDESNHIKTILNDLNIEYDPETEELTRTKNK